jgi:hypothetical protein
VPTTQTIRADDLRLVLSAAKLRRATNGRTPALCLLSPRPWLQVDCASSSEHTRPGLIATAKRLGPSPMPAQPMMRGHIGRLIERTRRVHGLAEIKRTWRTGLRALLAEPRHVLRGGECA